MRCFCSTGSMEYLGTEGQMQQEQDAELALKVRKVLEARMRGMCHSVDPHIPRAPLACNFGPDTSVTKLLFIFVYVLYTHKDAKRICM
jgi:hypothetical protein